MLEQNQNQPTKFEWRGALRDIPVICQNCTHLDFCLEMSPQSRNARRTRKCEKGQKPE